MLPLLMTAIGLPSSMTAVYKDGFMCFTPFKCVKTHTVPVPTAPGEGEVLIKVAASSVNPCDVDFIEYGVGCPGSGGTLGMDYAGEVVVVGSGCKRLKVGDAVWADSGALKGDTGGMAEYALLDEEQTGLKPASLNGTEAGTIPLVGLTALELWQKAGLPNRTGTNLSVVVTSGSGGTGFMGIQLGKAFGAEHVATATSAVNIPFVEALGADIVIDYHKQDLFDALPDDSIDIVFDNFGGKGTADKAMRTIRPGGVFILLPGGGGGTLSKHPKAGVTQINFGETTSSHHSQLDILKGLFDAGKLRAHVYAAFPLARAAEAFAMNKAGHVAGKVAVTAS